MPSWSEITQPYGEYVSEVFNISNTLSNYVVTIDVTEINTFNQQLDFFYSVSFDNVTWTEWETFYVESTDFLNGFNLSTLYFKYKVKIGATVETEKPYLQSISLTFEPFLLFENLGDTALKPKLWIRKKNVFGSITLINHMTGLELTLSNLENNEEVYIDCENEEIISSLQFLGVYRYDNHNDEWLELNRGETYLKGHGDFDMDIRYQNIILQD